MFAAPTLNLWVITPLIILTVWAIILMFIDLFIPAGKKQWTGWLTLVGLIPALALTLMQWGQTGGAFIAEGGQPMVVVDNFATFLNTLYLLTGILAVFISVSYIRDAGLERGEYYFLMLFSIVGMMLMGMANDLILIFLALELLSIPLYILSGFDTGSDTSEESALKYFLLGAFSSAFFLFGIALTYGATGTTSLPVILDTISLDDPLALAALGMLLVGFAFKVGAVPFHMWTPDVYEGAPTSVVAFMSVGAKVAGFAALMRVLGQGFPMWGELWQPAVVVISALTMIVGNFAAVRQQNIKRMLAYSGIANAGYILIGVAASATDPEAISASLYYMLAYLFTNIGAFAVVIAVEKLDGQKGLLVEDYKGLARRHLLLSLALAYFMFSLVGIPLTGGFTAKFYVFGAGVTAGLYWLVVIGAITSVVSAFYYLRPVLYAFMYEGPAVARVSRGLMFVLVVAVFATLVFGIFPGPWYELASQATFGNVATFVAGG
ncbi:MAG: NADH-quinone oxidoreductase subunit N [Anaerolineae bacterium]|nr:NADH-quinone oxidoreductase subunit N [Anaerolineae bacterium]